MIRGTLALILALAASPAAFADATTKEDVQKLLKARISDDVIIAFVRENPLTTKLTSDDIIELKKAGASDAVVTALIAAAPTKAKATEAPAPKETVQEPQAAPQRVYADSTPRTTYYVPSSTYDCYYGYSYPYTYYPYGYSYPSFSYSYSYSYPRYRSYGYYGGRSRYRWGVGFRSGRCW